MSCGFTTCFYKCEEVHFHLLQHFILKKHSGKNSPNKHTHTHTPTCLAYTSEDSYVLIYKVRLEVRWGPRSADPPKMVKHDVFGVFSQRFPRTRFWVLGRCRVLGVSVCFHMKVLGSISKANAHPPTPTHTPPPTHTYTQKVKSYMIKHNECRLVNFLNFILRQRSVSWENKGAIRYFIS